MTYKYDGNDPDADVKAFAELSKEDKEAAARLADAVAATPSEIDTRQVFGDDIITVENKHKAVYTDRMLSYKRDADGYITDVLLAGPPNHHITLGGSAEWKIVDHNPIERKAREVGLAYVMKDIDSFTANSEWGMWARRSDGTFVFVTDKGEIVAPDRVSGFIPEVVLTPARLSKFMDELPKELYGFYKGYEPSDETMSWDELAGNEQNVHYTFVEKIVARLKEFGG